MPTPRRRRNVFVMASSASGALLLAGCIPPTPPPRPAAAEPEPEPPSLASFAAIATVQTVDGPAGQVLLRTPGGAFFTVTPSDPRQLRGLHAGQRVLAGYDARGAARVAPPARRGAGWHVNGRVEEVEQGGHHIVLRDAHDGTGAFTLPHRAMMALAARLRPGEEVAIALAEASPAAGGLSPSGVRP